MSIYHLTQESSGGYTPVGSDPFAEMIKTSRSRLEIRQEPDRLSYVVGVLLVGVGGAEAMVSAFAVVAEWGLPPGPGLLLACIRLALAALFSASGLFFLRGRSRIVFDLDHRMVARYMGVGGRGGRNQSWDLADFAAVVLVRREIRRVLTGSDSRTEVVCLRRPDGDDLQLHWSDADGDAVAMRIAGFTGLPYIGRRRF